MKDENCIFCKILAGEIPSTAVYEDDDFKAILDVNPAARGHVIILPKNHAANIYELPDEDASKIMVVAKKIATAIEKAYHCDGVNILQNNGEAAGQTVFHLHVHVIPRFKGRYSEYWMETGRYAGRSGCDLQRNPGTAVERWNDR